MQWITSLGMQSTPVFMAQSRRAVPTPCARWGMFAASVRAIAAGSHEHNSNPEVYI